MTDKAPPPPDDLPPDQPPPYQGAYGQAPGATPYDQPPPGAPPYDQPPPGGAPPHDQPPPGGHYDPRWGYGPPGVPPGMPQQPPQETTWAIFSYVGIVLIGFLAPMIIYFVKKNIDPFVRFHAAQALNYQITMLIHLLAVAVICAPLAIAFENPVFLVMLIPPYLEAAFGQFVFIILGAIKSGKGQYFKFPTFFCFRMIR
ncbi:DUF4870 domain-containing protein [Actinomadura sp. 3N508]|uniref:DUF4870 domain-containing protein n=1 Tax=Actinomadura sp. 3N508 TaxID=3375153 RepID=UPI00379D0C66